MEKGYYPEYAVKGLEEVSEQLDVQFSRVWGLLSPSIERDEVMWHILTAKRKIHEMLEVNKNG